MSAGPDRLPHDEDLALAARCLAGETEAWERLVARLTPCLRAAAGRALRRYGLPSGPAEQGDLAQEVFSELLARDRAALKAYSGSASLETYATVIAAHRAYALAGSRRLLPLPEDADPPAPASSPGEGMDLDAARARMRGAMDRLPTRDRLALGLHLNGAPNAEVARVLGVSAGNAAVILARARGRVLDMLRGPESGKAVKSPA